MARKNPLGKIKDAADVAVLTVVGSVTESVKDPVATGQKVVGGAVGQAAAAVGAVTSRVGGRKGTRKQQGRRRRAPCDRMSRARPRATR